MLKRNVDVKAITQTATGYGWIRGNKLFELSNHLGNVLATVSDRKYGVSLNDTTVNYYTADVVNAQDYYPFGMIMSDRKGYAQSSGSEANETGVIGTKDSLIVTDRSANNHPAVYNALSAIILNPGFQTGSGDSMEASIYSGSQQTAGQGRLWVNGNSGTTNPNAYRYGFNGKENDNEVKGEANQQDYGMRIYDPRVGRFLSTDPISKDYPELTPYQFASNTPIVAIDLDGLEGFVATGINGHGMIISVEDARKAAPKVAEYSRAAAHSFVGDIKSLGKLKTYVDALDLFSLMFVPDVSSHIERNDKKRYEVIQGGINTVKDIPNWGPTEWGSATGHLAFQLLLSKAIKVAGGAEVLVKLRARLNSADAVNTKFLQQGWEAPYVPGVTVAEFSTVAKTDGLFRVSGPNNVSGSWFTTAEEIKGLSSAQLKDKFSLKYEPTSVTPVSIEAGATLRVGEAAAVKSFGTNGGGFQIELLEGQNKVNYGTTSPLNK